MNRTNRVVIAALFLLSIKLVEAWPSMGAFASANNDTNGPLRVRSALPSSVAYLNGGFGALSFNARNYYTKTNNLKFRQEAGSYVPPNAYTSLLSYYLKLGGQSASQSLFNLAKEEHSPGHSGHVDLLQRLQKSHLIQDMRYKFDQDLCAESYFSPERAWVACCPIHLSSSELFHFCMKETTLGILPPMRSPEASFDYDANSATRIAAARPLSSSVGRMSNNSHANSSHTANNTSLGAVTRSEDEYEVYTPSFIIEDESESTKTNEACIDDTAELICHSFCCDSTYANSDFCTTSERTCY